jgi:hypothetical protein
MAQLTREVMTTPEAAPIAHDVLAVDAASPKATHSVLPLATVVSVAGGSSVKTSVAVADNVGAAVAPAAHGKVFVPPPEYMVVDVLVAMVGGAVKTAQ